MFEARRLITKYKSGNSDFQSRLNKIKESTPDFMQFPVEPVERMANELWGSEGLDYLVNERHFDKETLEHFGVGYSAKKQMTIVPMHDPKGMLIGFIGRSIKEKTFKNSDKLPKSKTLWNFHRAKRHGETVIVVESSFDAMRVHQAGYQNVVATLGGHLSEHQANLLNKTFNTVVIMTDFDRKISKPNCRLCKGLCDGHRAGRDLGRAIIATLNNKRARWAAYDDTCVYPHGAKDVGDMTDEEIRQCLRNAIPNFEYISWDVESMDLVAS
jgi:5S rRNA maturation endonuclease (ribonuclease M5)